MKIKYTKYFTGRIKLNINEKIILAISLSIIILIIMNNIIK